MSGPDGKKSYIVSLGADTDEKTWEEAMKYAQDNGAEIGHKYKLTKAFQILLPAGDVVALDNVRHPSVQEIEEDRTVSINDAGN